MEVDIHISIYEHYLSKKRTQDPPSKLTKYRNYSIIPISRLLRRLHLRRQLSHLAPPAQLRHLIRLTLDLMRRQSRFAQIRHAVAVVVVRVVLQERRRGTVGGRLLLCSKSALLSSAEEKPG